MSTSAKKLQALIAQAEADLQSIKQERRHERRKFLEFDACIARIRLRALQEAFKIVIENND